MGPAIAKQAFEERFDPVAHQLLQETAAPLALNQENRGWGIVLHGECAILSTDVSTSRRIVLVPPVSPAISNVMTLIKPYYFFYLTQMGGISI
jgi:hypothetical protein